MTELPAFTADGVLRPGDYDLTLVELRNCYLVTGEGVQSTSWDAVWRAQLVDSVSVLVHQLWQVGIDRIFIDGSFVEAQDHPNDIDGYFECDARYLLSGQLQRDLNALDPHKIWTWSPASRRFDPNSGKRQLPMWHQYQVELYPHLPGVPCGIQDRCGNDLEFPSAFRISRRGDLLRGIVRISQVNGGNDDPH